MVASTLLGSAAEGAPAERLARERGAPAPRATETEAGDLAGLPLD